MPPRRRPARPALGNVAGLPSRGLTRSWRAGVLGSIGRGDRAHDESHRSGVGQRGRGARGRAVQPTGRRPMARRHLRRVPRRRRAPGQGADRGRRSGRRPHRPDEPDALRVDAGRLRDLVGRGGHRADLRDVQFRAGRLDPVRLGRGCLLRGDTGARGDRRRGARPVGRFARRLGHRRRRSRAARGARRRHIRLGDGPAADRGHGRRRRHDHLYERHHGPTQGLCADPSEHVFRYRQRDTGPAQPFPRRCQHVAVPAARALVRAADPDRRGDLSHTHAAHRRHQEPGR